jgi:hypothetical protein
MAETFTISAAARRCGVTRRTLQRAIHTGRLTLTSDHRITTAALEQAGYTPQATSQRPVTATSQAQAVTEHLAHVVERLDRLITLLEAQHDAATPQRYTAVTSQRHEGRRRSDDAGSRPRDDAGTAPAFDATRFVLGRLCPRGHDYQGTGHALRKRHSGSCVACEREQQRERRARRRQGG